MAAPQQYYMAVPQQYIAVPQQYTPCKSEEYPRNGWSVAYSPVPGQLTPPLSHQYALYTPQYIDPCQNSLPKTDSRSWNFPSYAPTYSPSYTTTNLNKPLPPLPIDKDKPLPPLPYSDGWFYGPPSLAERAMLASCRDQQDFLSGCAAAWTNVDRMGGLQVYHQRKIEEEERRQRGSGGFKWKLW
jgi:hypothetical protein